MPISIIFSHGQPDKCQRGYMDKGGCGTDICSLWCGGPRWCVDVLVVFFFFLNRIHPGVGTTAPSESHLWEHDSSSHPILNSLRFGLKLWFVSQKIPWIRGLISCYSLEGEHLLGPEFLLASWLFSNQSIVLVILELLLIPGLEDNSFSLILGI